MTWIEKSTLLGTSVVLLLLPFTPEKNNIARKGTIHSLRIGKKKKETAPYRVVLSRVYSISIKKFQSFLLVGKQIFDKQLIFAKVSMNAKAL